MAEKINIFRKALIGKVAFIMGLVSSFFAIGAAKGADSTTTDGKDYDDIFIVLNEAHADYKTYSPSDYNSPEDNNNGSGPPDCSGNSFPTN